MPRISFCNFALAKELFKRNWYVSALYLLGWLLALVPTISRMRYTVYVYSLDPTNSLSSYLPLFLTFSAFFTLAYCVVATCVNCDYLFKPEAARFYGAGALRRSTLLLTSFVVTVLPGLAVNVIAGLLFTFAELSAGFELCLGPTLVASGCLLVIIHSGLCLLCAALSSSRLVFIIVTLMLHGYACVVDFGFKTATDLFSYGVTGNLNPSSIALIFSPMAQMETQFVMPTRYATWYDFWGMLAAYAIVAVIAVAVACVLFKYRRVEEVGEGVAFKKLRPVFSIMFSIAFGLGFALVGCAFADYDSSAAQQANNLGLMGALIGFYLLGALGSYAVLESIMAKSARVIKRRLPGLALVALLCVGVSAGAYGVASCESKYVPAESDIESVFVDGLDFVADNPENIKTVTDLHQSIIDEHESPTQKGLPSANATYSGKYIYEGTTRLDASSYYRSYVSFNYEMKNGDVIKRGYDICLLKDELNDPASFSSKIASFASSDAARQNRIDWLYDLAESRPTAVVGSVNLYHGKYGGVEILEDEITQTDDAPGSLDVTLTGNELKELLDAGMANELLTSAAYDPGLAIWAQGKDNAEYWENVIGYLNPGVYAYDGYGEGAIDRFQIYSAVNLSFQETPKALAWIAQHYRIDLSEAMQQL